MIITAAGMSTRQKRNKLLIRQCHETIIEKTIYSMQNDNIDIFIVVGHQKEKIIPILKHRFGNDITIVENSKFKMGLSTSLIEGITKAGSKYDYYAFCNGDKPYIKSETVKLLLKYLMDKKPEILIPIFQDQSGHPTLFSTIYYDELLQLEGDVGGKQLIDKHLAETTYLPVNDEGIILDMDKYLEDG